MPRINQSGTSRPSYYDRNPTPQIQTYDAGVGPHAATTRWTYTVTAAKKSFVQRVLAQLVRLTAAGAAGQAAALINYLPAAGGSALPAQAQVLTNAVGDRDRDSFTGAGYAGAGDQFLGKSYDLSTGGTFEMVVALWAVEFDA